jgi:glycosyltransferase involved in cell wall biosynthesis
MIKLAVIVPLFNSRKYIRETIESLVICKNYIDQILFIDNGSTDETLIIVKETMLNQMIKYEVIKNPKNLGISAAMRIGFSRLVNKTDYIMRLDHDDLIDLNYIRCATAYAVENIDVGLISPQIKIFDKNPSLSKEVYSDLVFMGDRRDKFIHLFNTNPFPASGTIYKSSVLKKFFYNSKNDWANDWELALHIALNHPIKQLKDEFIYYRTGIESLSSTFSDSSRDIFYLFMRIRILTRIYFENNFVDKSTLEILYSQSSWMHERFPLTYLATRCLIPKMFSEVDQGLFVDFDFNQDTFNSIKDRYALRILNEALSSKFLTFKTSKLLFLSTYFKTADSNSIVSRIR